MNLKNKFSDADLQRIKAAVKEAESRISGEIVPVIVERSGVYAIANYRASMAFAAITFLLIIFFDRYVPLLAVYDPLLIFLVVLLAGILGSIIPNFFGLLKRSLVSQQLMDLTTRQSAENAFLEEEVFNTRHRTGIMIFISFFEHEVIVMADRGISKVVEQKYWDKIVQELVTHIRKGKLVEGVENAIYKCGEILLEKGFHKTQDDINELRDDLRIN
jgi:putative membrane protein